MVLEWDRPEAMAPTDLQYYVLEMDRGKVPGANLKEIYRGMLLFASFWCCIHRACLHDIVLCIAL